MNNSTNQEIRVMLLGSSGAGKSRTGNNIIGHKVFEVGNGGKPVTKKCKIHAGERFGKHLYLVDTPGVAGEHENKALLDEIKRGLQISNGGPHVFLLVTEMGRTVEFRKVFLRYQYLFGEKMFKYAIVVFTNFDVWKDRFIDDHDQDPDVDQYLKSLPDEVMNLLGKCKDRYIVFDNKCKGDDMEKQLTNLIEKIKNLITFNKDDEVYTEEQQEERHPQNDMPRKQGNGWVLKAGFSAAAIAVFGLVFSRFSK